MKYSCYYIICFGSLWALLNTYIIFGTNLLTRGPAQIAVFLPISVFQRKGISNGMKPSGELFFEQKQSRRLEVDVRDASRKPRGREACPTPPGRAPHPRGHLETSFTSTPSLLDHIRSKNNAPEGFIPFGLRLIFLFFETLKYARKQRHGLGLRLIG